MQKKLIAVAVAGLFSTAAFAQTTVTLGGLMDLGYQYGTLEAAGVKTKVSNFGVTSGSATSNVNIRAIEDLGGGMKATVYIETDPAAGTNAGALFASAPNWIELSGGFGAVSLGLINNFALTAATTAQPLGTAIGSAYSGAFGRLDGVNVLGTFTVAPALGGAGVRDIRVNNAIQYKTPSFNGFSGGFQYKVKNTDAGAGAANQIGQQQIGLGYNNGPLNIAYAHSQIQAAAVLGGTSSKLTHQLLGANYSFGPATIYAGYTTSKASTSTDLNTTSWNIAGKYAFTPTLAGMLNVVRVNDKTVGDQDRNLNGLGLDYSMSKRTTAYLRFENGDNDKSGATGGGNGSFTRYALGLRHSF
jgi:predicted porin